MKLIIVLVALVAFTAAKPSQTRKINFLSEYKDSYVSTIHDLNRSPRLIGGVEAEPHSVPYQATIEFWLDIEGWFCGGSLISSKHIITAGHCGHTAEEAYVQLGAHELYGSDPTQEIIESRQIVVHPEFDRAELRNDIAIIILPKEVELNSAIQPVKLPSPRVISDYVGKVGKISGYGILEGAGGPLTDVLHYVDAEIITNKECARVFRGVYDSNLCTSGKDLSGSCHGDSGGPLTIGDIQIGIVSFGIKGCWSGFPSGFTRVSYFLDWIVEVTNIALD